MALLAIDWVIPESGKERCAADCELLPKELQPALNALNQAR